MSPNNNNNNSNHNNNNDNYIDDDNETTNVSWTGSATTSSTGSSTSSATTEHADSTITSFDIHPTSTSTSSSSNSNSNNNTLPNTARWTKYIPEAYGLRKSIESSKYRWCARESSLWGIATGTAMALHRIRMNSPISRIINIGFTTTFIVMIGSYYFCVKKRDYHEQMIELLMKLNTFEPIQNIPLERPIDDTHPFVIPIDVDDNNNNNNDTTNTTTVVPTKQYIAHLPERKEWQTPIPTQDASNIFQPYNTENSNNKNNNNDKTPK